MRADVREAEMPSMQNAMASRHKCDAGERAAFRLRFRQDGKGSPSRRMQIENGRQTIFLPASAPGAMENISLTLMTMAPLDCSGRPSFFPSSSVQVRVS